MKILKRPIIAVLSVLAILLLIMNFNNDENGSFVELHAEEIAYAAPGDSSEVNEESEIEKAEE